MSARKIDSSLLAQPSQRCLTLSAHAVRIRKSGIEFASADPIAIWTEMNVDLQSRRDAKKVHCTGVVVACNGNREDGYSITMLFTNLSRQSQARLESLSA